MPTVSAHSSRPPTRSEAGDGITISGRVTDWNGQPVSDVTVIAIPGGNRAVTDSLGNYRIDFVAHDTVTVIAATRERSSSGSGYIGSGFIAPPRRLRLRGSVANVNLRLAPRRAALAVGRILDYEKGWLRGIPVKCTQRTVTTQDLGWYLCLAYFDEANRLIVEPHAPRGFRALFVPPTYEIGATSEYAKFDADFTISLSQGDLVIDVLRRDGEGIPDAIVDITVRYLNRFYTDSMSTSYYTVATGSVYRRAVFPGVPNGARVTILARLPDGARYQRTLTMKSEPDLFNPWMLVTFVHPPR